MLVLLHEGSGIKLDILCRSLHLNEGKKQELREPKIGNSWHQTGKNINSKHKHTKNVEKPSFP